jgi:hypothetical protein
MNAGGLLRRMNAAVPNENTTSSGRTRIARGEGDALAQGEGDGCACRPPTRGQLSARPRLQRCRVLDVDLDEAVVEIGDDHAPVNSKVCAPDRG